VGGVAEWIGHRGRAGRKRFGFVGWRWSAGAGSRCGQRHSRGGWEVRGKLPRGSEDIIAGGSRPRCEASCTRSPVCVGAVTVEDSE
jgi:hypothetical protein